MLSPLKYLKFVAFLIHFYNSILKNDDDLTNLGYQLSGQILHLASTDSRF